MVIPGFLKEQTEKTYCKEKIMIFKEDGDFTWFITKSILTINALLI